MGRSRITTGSALAALVLLVSAAGPAATQTTPPPQAGSAVATPDNAILLTELNEQLAKQGFYKAFPPPGIEIVSWNVVMGIGQIITLRLPATRLREINRVLEDTAWGAYRTEFYPTYDYKAVGLAEHDKAR
jgi:hypothetical protein